MVRALIISVSILAGAVGVDARAALAGPAKTVQRIRGFELVEEELVARYRDGVLRVTLPYHCNARCGGRLTVGIRTLAGRGLASRAVRRVKPTFGGGRLRLSFPLRLSQARVELAVLRYRYRQGDEQVVSTLALSRFLDGPEIRVLGQDRIHAGTAAVFRVLVRRRSDGRPFAGARVSATLTGRGLRGRAVRGRTDAGGAWQPSFPLPERLAGKGLRLRIRTWTPLGTRTATSRVRVRQRVRTLLTVDKPIYQPGQTIHLRTLSLRAPTGKAVARAPVTFRIRDGRDNLVHQVVTRTDAFGVAHTRFRLADRVNQGRYRITAQVRVEGGASRPVTRAVRVLTYRLPRFRVRVRLGRAYYRPGDTVTGEAYVWWVFGKPVQDGRVVVTAARVAGETKPFGKVDGRTDRWGAFRFRFVLGRDFPAKALDAGSAAVRIEVAARAPGNPPRRAVAGAPVVRRPVRVTLVPESGELEPGIRQRVHVLTTLPDGSPVATRVRLSVEQPGLRRVTTTLRTDDAGIGRFVVRPPARVVWVVADAQDAQGRQGSLRTTLVAHRRAAALLVRPARALYDVGDKMVVTVRSNRAHRFAYLDLIRAGQTVSTHTVRMVKGEGRVTVGLTAQAAGVLLLSAYHVDRDGGRVSDVRPVLVRQDRALRVEVTADRPRYEPGQRATIRFRVTDGLGQPVRAALGVWIVDSAVYALAGAQPGAARAFFGLEQALLRPEVELPGIGPRGLLAPSAGARRRRQARIAGVLLSATAPGYRPSLDVSGEAQHVARRDRRVAAVARPLVRRIGGRVAYAVVRYFRRRDCDDDAPGLETLLRKRYLGSSQVRDPWGERVRVSMDKDSDRRQVSLTVTSSGPDEVFGSDDDVSITRKLWLRGCVRPRWSGGALGRIHVSYARVYSMSLGSGGYGLGGGGRGFARLRSVGSPGAYVRTYSARPTRRAPVAPGRADPSGSEPVRVRNHFPEALAIRPSLITDAEGRATLRLRMADSITTWKLSALASSAAGQLGAAERDLQVLTKFFVEVTVPPELTRGDRVTVPVVLHNYQPTPERVRVSLKPAPWFRVVGPSAVRTVTVRPRGVATTAFTIEAHRVASGRLTVIARGQRVSDAVRRPVAVRPDGDRVDVSHADGLSSPLLASVNIPPEAVPGSGGLRVQVSPGALSAAVDGLDAMLREPHGCFEQTSSTTYPNVMILQYLKRQRRRLPRVAARARRLVAAGYQRLVTFELKTGGFSLFGGNPADKALTAYGLHEFLDMSRVIPVDPGLLRRTRRFLARAQRADGAWDPKPSYFYYGRTTLPDRVRVTAYVAWALQRAGQRGHVMRRAERYVLRHLSQVRDPYTLAMVASFLAARSRRHRALPPVLGRLLGQQVTRGRKTHWKLGRGQTITRSQGAPADVETTALVTATLIRARRHLDVARRALRYLVAAKGASFGWGSTQANVLAIQALLGAQRLGGSADARGTVDVALDGRPVGQLQLTAASAGVTQALDLGRYVKRGRRHRVTVRFRGKGFPMAQVLGSYHRPYARARRARDPILSRVAGIARSPLTLDVSYATLRSTTRRPVTARVKLSNTGRLAALSPMIELGRPAGFEPVVPDLQRLVRKRRIARFEVQARRVVVYLRQLGPGAHLAFRYRLRASHPQRVTAPPSEAYEYYASHLRARTGPTVLTVR